MFLNSVFGKCQVKINGSEAIVSFLGLRPIALFSDLYYTDL